ncbi:hypothetical protein ACIRRH_11620 [Kitasatospora sp. NPDC101235]|uniref:hypothetical protein n=1 Tax=Kitasatospora sp. NPDC101235 TaxID=3364101 RepID=UPI00382CB05E
MERAAEERRRDLDSAVAALRTLKSDVIVGLDAAAVARLDGTGTPWRTDGRHAVVQVDPRA